MTTDVGNDVAVYEFMQAYDEYKQAEEDYKALRISKADFQQAKDKFEAFSKHATEIPLAEFSDESLFKRVRRRFSLNAIKTKNKILQSFKKSN